MKISKSKSQKKPPHIEAKMQKMETGLAEEKWVHEKCIS